MTLKELCRGRQNRGLKRERLQLRRNDQREVRKPKEGKKREIRLQYQKPE